MTSHRRSIPAVSLAALLLCAGSSQAASLRSDMKPATVIQTIHYDHRECSYSPTKGWHRHVGEYANRTVSCEPNAPHDCKGEVEGRGTSYWSRNAAKQNAIAAWRADVIGKYGDLYAEYDMARQRNSQCARTKDWSYTCRVSARPCEVPHVPE